MKVMRRKPVSDGVEIRLEAAHVSRGVDRGEEKNVVCVEGHLSGRREREVC